MNNSGNKKKINDRTSREWIQLLIDQQQQLKNQMRNGCPPNVYKTLADLEQAMELVINRLNDSYDSALSNHNINSHHQLGDIHTMRKPL